MEYQLLVIGGGPGGYTAALDAAARGLKTAVAEPRELGGTCLNRGCIPTKVLLHTAELLHQTRDAAAIGLQIGDVHLDYAALEARKEQVTGQLRGGIEALFRRAGVTWIRERAVVTGPHQVRLGDQEITAEHILLAVGSVPAVPPIPGADLPGVHTSDTLLAQVDQPLDSLVIVGGGVIGMEFASFYSALGVKVTVLEAMDRILPNLDREIAQNLRVQLKKQSVDIFTGARVEEIAQSDGKLCCRFLEKEKQQEVFAEGVLIATGRRPATGGLLEGVEVHSERGYLTTNAFGQTSIPSIYAIGDVVAGGIQLAHAAEAAGHCAVAHICGVPAPVRMDLIPSCVYTSPEIACVGLDEEAAKAAGIPVRVRKCVLNANAKSILTGQGRSFMKLVEHGETGCVLGAQLMCARATDMISEFTLAIAAGLHVSALAKIVRPHPTFNEAASELFR